jgi:glycosyltransferase involved in cell wall biosynthesis
VLIMPPTVSVIIPAHNAARTLRACLEAVHAQRHPVTEVIVVDDASTDGTRDIAAAFDCRVLVADRNAGPAAARNRGIRASRGELLFFVDSDCAPEPEALGNALAILRAQPDVACVHGIYSLRPLIDDGPVEAYRLLHGHHWRLRNVGRVRTTLFAVCVIRREVFTAVGLFDERLRASEDVELGDRMGDRYGIVLTDTVVCRHDDDSHLGRLLRKQFGRSQLLIPVALAERGPAGVRANSPAGLATALLVPFSLLALPLVALAGAAPGALLALPLGCFALFVAAEPALLRFVARRRGAGFVPFFFGVHLLVQLTIVAGAVRGGLRYLVDRDFGPSRLPPVPPAVKPGR